MTAQVVISDGIAEAIVVPHLGAGLARYDLFTSAGREPLLRPASSRPQESFELALNLLVPWSNRISGGGFTYQGRFHALAPNLSGEEFPIHGDAFEGAWSLIEAGRAEVRLAYPSPGIGPFLYDAEILYRLDLGSLTMRLAIVSRSRERLPFGFGFHPWFVRTKETWLTARARTLWLEDTRHLPVESLPVSKRSEWDFTTPRRLPVGWINNGFEGWDGAALIEWRDRGLALTVAADSRLSTFLLYSPSADAGFFCFEPTSHPVDAHNLADRPETHGLVILAPGERIETWCRLTPARH